MPYGRTHTSHARAAELVHLFRHQLSMSRLGPGERCVCITDTAWNPAYAAACMAASQLLDAEAMQVVFPLDRPPSDAAVAAALHGADLIVYATSHTLHYRQPVRAALDRGARVLCAMQPLHVMSRLSADAGVRARTRAGAALLHAARRIRIASASGTDLMMDKTGRPALPHYGFADEAGHLDFWGGAMVEAAQLEGTTEGRLVLDVGDCCFLLGRLVESPVTITFRAGSAVAIQGGLDAFLIREQLAQAGGDRAFMAGHMGWGTDRRARWTQPLMQVPEHGGGGADNEAMYGVVQVELGSNNDVCFRGTNATAAHLGLCLRNASLWLDDAPVIEDGRFVHPALPD
jgi:2,5-dihydroxypyridine 5,6-dioxygenase